MNQLEIGIAARKYAEEIVAFCGEQPPRFWEVLSDLACAKGPPIVAAADPCPPLTEREAIAFESHALPYGKHAGTAVGCVDCGYLLFLTEGDEFSKRLRRYVKSQRFQDRQVD